MNDESINQSKLVTDTADQSIVQEKKFIPWETYTILGITLLVYLAQNYFSMTQGKDWLFELGAKDNAAIAAGQYWRLITPIFLHLSILQIGVNLYSLYVIGKVAEKYYDRVRFVLLYFLSGIAGNVVSYYLSSRNEVGASPAVFGIVSAYAVFVFQNRDFFGDQAQKILKNIFIIVGLNLALGFLPIFDNWVNIGGIAGGLAFTWAAGPLLSTAQLPSGNYIVFDRRTNRTIWIVCSIQLAIMALLVFMRV